MLTWVFTLFLPPPPNNFYHYNLRDYLQVKLSDTLNIGTKYFVCFFVSLSDSSKWACNNMGAYFSDSALTYNGGGYVKSYLNPQVANDTANNPLTDKINWIKISGSFTAQGGETYLIIGNFTENKQCDSVFVDSPTGNGIYNQEHAYYYIDDVIVSPDSAYVDSLTTGLKPHVKPKELAVKVFPNPANTVLHVDMIQKVQDVNNSFCLYNATGQRVKCVTFNSMDNTLSIGTLPTGLYYYRLKDVNGKVLKTGKLTIVH